MRHIAALALLALAVGCRAQVPTPTAQYSTQWTWSAPAAGGLWPGCSASLPCAYIVSVEVITGTTCDPVTSSNYKQLNPASPVAATSYLQTGTTGETVCGVVTTVWNGANSQPSLPSAPATMPSLPLAPGAPSGSSTAADLVKLALPVPAASPQMAFNMAPMRMAGRAVRNAR